MSAFVTTRRVIAASCALALLGAAAPAFAAAKPAETYVAGVLVEANAVFAKPKEADRRAGIDALVAKHVDLDRTGMFVLGQYARVMTPAQKAEYQPLFRRFAARVYQNTLAGYKGEALQVTGSTERSPTDVVVNSRFVAAAASSEYAKSVV
ncbi:MAG: ABC transporter substrate-binding protein, partial [Parvularculaceae bacterium]|nr:ABC transporter substrate-binding protein [Parvularculaceae bacterium]